MFKYVLQIKKNWKWTLDMLRLWIYLSKGIHAKGKRLSYSYTGQAWLRGSQNF